MYNKHLQNAGLFLLAVIFSIGLMFAFTELPILLDQFLQKVVQTPHSDPAYDSMRIELFYSAYAIRLIGFICLGLILVFIIIGFASKRTAWAWIGSIAIFLPVFATFAHSMFYLAGLGLFNVILFPLQDISLAMVDLGKVVLVPYWILVWFLGLFNWHAHGFLMYFFMITGALIFVLGVFAWFRTRYSKDMVAREWIYRYSRHPQYLGWIIWSYGLMLYGPTLNQMKKSWGWNGTLPWLLSTMVIIGICLLEEMKMKERSGKEYEEYRNRTPFLMPLPGFINWILKVPMRLIMRSKRPEKRSDVGIVITVYTLLLVVLSLFWMDLSPNRGTQNLVTRSYDQETVDSVVYEIRRPQQRRNRTLEPYGVLVSMGDRAYPVISELIRDEDPVIREFSIIAAYHFNVKETIPAIIGAIDDPEDRVSWAAIRGLGEIGAVEATDTLLYYLKHPDIQISRDRILQTMSKLGCSHIFPYLENQFYSEVWYHRSGALRSMAETDPVLAKPYLYKALDDADEKVRRDVVSILLEMLPEDAIPHLQKLIDDDCWDVRFYARQAIKLIEKENGH